MKHLLFIPILLLAASCSIDNVLQQFIETASSSTSTECPTKPGNNISLSSDKVKEIALDGQVVNESGQVNMTQSVGFSFEAEAGQKLSYKTNDDLCIWTYTPENNILNGTDITTDGKHTIQIAARQGSTTFDLEIGLNAPQSSLLPSSSTPSPSQSNTPKLTQQEAKEIVQQWYDAKPKIFGRSFDTQLVENLATGSLYYETLRKDGGGSVGWLRENGCYYDYEYSYIDGTESFSASSDRPKIVLKVREKLNLNGPSSAGCSQPPKTYRAYATYWFEQDNGVWKIEDYDVN